MYSISVTSIPITNVEDRDKEVVVKGSSITLQYGSMIKRSIRIDDDMLSDILDSGDAVIKVFRYIKSHTNAQTNKVRLKASDVIAYLNSYNKKINNSAVSRAIDKLSNIGFIKKANTLEIYKHEPSNVYLVNPNYFVVSSPDVVFRRIQSDERMQKDAEMIFNLDRQRLKLQNDALRLRDKRHRNKTIK